MNNILFFLACAGAFFIFSCASPEKEKNESISRPIEVIDTVVKDSIVETPVLKVNYHLAGKDVGVEWNFDSLTAEQLNTILIINRIDLADVWKADSLVVPDTLSQDIMDYSPFPKSILSIQGIRKILLVSYKIQAFGAYENGTLVRWGPASLGKKSTPTPTGLFHTNWKAKETISTIDSGWVLKWYFNFDNFSGVSLHEYELPGYPASHSCIRLYPEDAYFFYYWAEQWILESDIKISAYGTPLIVFGEYPFGMRKPWLCLKDDAHCLDFTAVELANIVEEYLPLVFQRQMKRDSLQSF